MTVQKQREKRSNDGSLCAIAYRRGMKKIKWVPEDLVSLKTLDPWD
jgi:hypothetical protein